MNKSILIVCLFLATIASTQYFLSPAYPPSAYQNEYYNTRFRVRGLDNPAFTFVGLPKSISGTTDGVLSGIPTECGSFSITINYKSGNVSGSNNAILKVLTSSKTGTNASVQVVGGLAIDAPKNLIFVVGQPINLNFPAKNSKGKLVWVFNGLPNGVVGNSALGSIQGTIGQSGYYNFNVECGDEDGKSAQVFLTINVQPKTTLTTTQIVDVPKEKSTNPITYDLIEKEQVAADSELFTALDNVNTRKAVVSDVKKHVAVATLRVQKAQASYDAADAAWRQTSNDKEVAASSLRNAQKSLDATQKNLELAQTQQTSAANNVAEQRKRVDAAQKRFNDAQKAYSAANDKFVQAKADLQKCTANLRDAQSVKDAADLEYKRAMTALEAAKNQLQMAKAKKQKADQAVKAAKDTVELASLARDNAESNLKEADFNLNKTNNDLAAALQSVSGIRDKVNKAAEEGNDDQWEFELALNKLYVAQARKEAADRASAIALADGSYSDHNINNGFRTIGRNGAISLNGGSSSSFSSAPSSFSGCDAKNYPLITGTSQIQSLTPNGYQLSSGQQVVYGGCSQASTCKVGDFVSYNGYFVDGVINAFRIKRVLLS